MTRKARRCFGISGEICHLSLLLDVDGFRSLLSFAQASIKNYWVKPIALCFEPLLTKGGKQGLSGRLSYM